MVVCIDRWSAVAITVIGLAPVAARFVSAVCRMSWNARILPSTPAAASALVDEVRAPPALPIAKFRTVLLGEDLIMKPGRPIEASESPDRAQPVRPLLVAAAVAAAAIFLALIFRRLR